MTKILKFLMRIFLDAYRDTKRVVNYFHLVSINGVFVIPKIYFIRLIYSFSFVRNLIKIKILNNLTFSKYFMENNIFSKNVTEIIDLKGCSEVYTLKKDLVDGVVEDIFASKNIEYKKNNNLNIIIPNEFLFKCKNESLEFYYNRLKEKKISRVTGFIDLNKESYTRNLLTSSPFVSLAQNYLDVKNFSINASFFISNPVITPEEEKYANAQYFHWDNDFTKFLKVYIYLSDVDQESGPHIIIPNTHKKKLLKHSLCRLYKDKDIYSSYSQKTIFTGKAGSIFFSDGYGLHKGETPKSKSRLILNVHYGRNNILYSSNDVYFKS
jgi:hypothetical protein